MEKDMLAVAQDDDVNIPQLFASLPPFRKKHAHSVGVLTEHLIRWSLADPQCGYTYSNTPEKIREATVYHDIGMSVIPDCILNKADALTSKEQKVLQLHSLYGAKMLDRHRKKFNHSPDEKSLWALAAEIALSHHEQWDGHGYPYAQLATAILPEVRAVSVSEAYDTIVRGESYCMPLPHEFAIMEIADKSGSQFDPYFSGLCREHEAELRIIWEEQNVS